MLHATTLDDSRVHGTSYNDLRPYYKIIIYYINVKLSDLVRGIRRLYKIL
jgi:hypothetical protein